MAGVTHLVQPPLVVLQWHLVVRTLPAHHLWGVDQADAVKSEASLTHGVSPLNYKAIRSGSTSDVHHGRVEVHCGSLWVVHWCGSLLCTVVLSLHV